mmetsp:Transcript_103395/g.183677  ORF Transcript_103395/g.183677 Transcript_103395/m.183677 type:complete len:1372 (-) Transcript_103395:284-4399(-)
MGDEVKKKKLWATAQKVKFAASLAQSVKNDSTTAAAAAFTRRQSTATRIRRSSDETGGSSKPKAVVAVAPQEYDDDNDDYTAGNDDAASARQAKPVEPGPAKLWAAAQKVKMGTKIMAGLRPAARRSSVAAALFRKPTGEVNALANTEGGDGSTRSSFASEEEEDRTPEDILIDEHRLFQGTQKDFRRQLASEVVQQSYQTFQLPVKEETVTHNTLDQLFPPLSTGKEHPVVQTAWEDVPEELNGFLFVHPDDASCFQILYNDVPLAEDWGQIPGMAGQEVAMRLTNQSPFTVQLLREPARGLFFIPAADFHSVCAAFPLDADKISQRIHEAAASIIKSWNEKFVMRVTPKLFTNCPDFGPGFIEHAQIRLVRAGTVMSKEGDPASDKFFYLEKGTAEISKNGVIMLYLSHARGARAWQTWWGMLEALGTCAETMATVTAMNDCILWSLTGSCMEELRLNFRRECLLVEKVAARHLEMIEPQMGGVRKIQLFEDCGKDFVRALCSNLRQRIVMRDEIICKEGEGGDEMFVMMHGKCRVLRGFNNEVISRLHAGNNFGHLALLDVCRTRTATIKADTLCDVRKLTRAQLLAALGMYPEEGPRFQEIVEVYSQSRKAATAALTEASESAGGFTQDFMKTLIDNMYEQPFMMKQHLLVENTPGTHLIVLVHGTVDIESNGIRVATVSAPAIFGESALLYEGSVSSATVRSSSMSECLVYPVMKQTTQVLFTSFSKDIRMLESMLEQKKKSTKHVLNAKDLQALPSSNHTLGMLKHCSPSFISRLSANFDKQIYLSGQCLFTEGEEADHGVIIQQGTASLEMAGRELDILAPGEFIGEFAILGHALPSTATIRAESRVTVFVISKDGFADVLEEFPEERASLEDILRRRMEDQKSRETRKTQFGKAGQRPLIVNLKAISKMLGESKSKRESVQDDVEPEPDIGDVVETDDQEGERVVKIKKKKRQSADEYGPGWASGLQWAKQRKEAMGRAPILKERRELKGLTTSLPQWMSYRPPEAGLGTPWAAEARSLTMMPWEQRLRKTEDVYGRKVWDDATRQYHRSQSPDSDSDSSSSSSEAAAPPRKLPPLDAQQGNAALENDQPQRRYSVEGVLSGRQDKDNLMLPPKPLLASSATTEAPVSVPAKNDVVSTARGQRPSILARGGAELGPEDDLMERLRRFMAKEEKLAVLEKRGHRRWRARNLQATAEADIEDAASSNADNDEEETSEVAPEETSEVATPRSRQMTTEDQADHIGQETSKSPGQLSRPPSQGQQEDPPESLLEASAVTDEDYGTRWETPDISDHTDVMIGNLVSEALSSYSQETGSLAFTLLNLTGSPSKPTSSPQSPSLKSRSASAASDMDTVLSQPEINIFPAL